MITKTAFQKIYTKLTRITKATCSVRASGVGNEELAVVHGRLAQVVKIIGDEVTLQIFSGTEGLPTDAELIFLGNRLYLRLVMIWQEDFLTLMVNLLTGPALLGKELEIGGPSVNPVRRKQPSQLIATGIAG